MAIRRKTKERALGSPDLAEVVASAEVDLRLPEDVRWLQTILTEDKRKAQKPWKWYENIGEVHYAVSRGSRIAGYAKIQARKLERDGSLGEVITGGQAAEVAESLRSPYGGARGLIERYYTQSKVPGDSYLIRIRDADGDIEGYDFLSPDEVDLGDTAVQAVEYGRPLPLGAGGIRRITHPGGKGNSVLTDDVRADDFLGRIWRPSARYVDMADSPLRALETTCEMLHLLTQSMKSRILSRFSLNGILYIANEIKDISTAVPDGGDSTEVRANSVLDRLVKAATFMVQNFDDPRAAAPIFLSGPAAYVDAVKHIVFDRDIAETDLKHRVELIDRLLMGLDVQPQDVRGMGDSNHWSAWAVSDDERRVNIQPDLEVCMWALTRMVLHREMLAANQKPGKITSTVLWYDLSAANVKTNLAEDARQALDRILIGEAPARRYMGLSEADAPSDVEQIRIFGRFAKDPYLATFELPAAERIDWDKVAAKKPGPGKEPGDADAEGGPKTSSPTPESNTPRKLRPA